MSDKKPSPKERLTEIIAEYEAKIRLHTDCASGANAQFDDDLRMEWLELAFQHQIKAALYRQVIRELYALRKLL